MHLASLPAALLSQRPRLDGWELEDSWLYRLLGWLSLAAELPAAWQRHPAVLAACGMQHALCMCSGHAPGRRSIVYFEAHILPSLTAMLFDTHLLIDMVSVVTIHCSSLLPALCCAPFDSSGTIVCGESYKAANANAAQTQVDRGRGKLVVQAGVYA